MTVVALDPTSGPIDARGGGAADGSAPRRLASRPDSLEGERLGLVVNGLGYSERFMDALAAELRAITGIDDVVKVVKSSVSVPPDPGDWSRLTEGATVAVTGFGG